MNNNIVQCEAFNNKVNRAYFCPRVFKIPYNVPLPSCDSCPALKMANLPVNLQPGEEQISASFTELPLEWLDAFTEKQRETIQSYLDLRQDNNTPTCIDIATVLNTTSQKVYECLMREKERAKPLSDN